MLNPPIEQEQNPELWVPDRMPEFKVGMRVRWRISPECSWSCSGCGTSFHTHHTPSGTGIIKWIATSSLLRCELLADYHCGAITGLDGHLFGVKLGEPTERGDSFWAAASELILVTEEEE